MIEMSPEFKDITAALLKFQGIVSGVHKEKANPAFRSKYAPLDTVVDAIRPGLQQVGVFFTQAPGLISEGKLTLTTLLIHPESGQWLRYTMQTALAKTDPQAVGSATTYSQRYSLMAALGVPPTDDDDGNEASQPNSQSRRPNDLPAQPRLNPSRQTVISTGRDVVDITEARRVTDEDRPLIAKWVKEIERCASKADLQALMRMEEWLADKPKLSDAAQTEIRDAIGRHPAYQRGAA